MRVFVTGASGFVGSAIVQELIGAGHQVLGLARSAAAASSLVKAGAEVHPGNLNDIDSLLSGAAAADAVIHTAFNHDDFSKFKESTEADKRIIEALGTVYAGSDRPIIVTSALGVLKYNGSLLTEADKPGGLNPRGATEVAADAVAATGVRIAVVRLAPSVHGDGDHGFIPMLIGIAKAKGVSVYAAEGLNYWPAVHVLDAARLYRLLLEQAFTPGTRYHVSAEEGIPFRDIATIIAKRLNIPVVSKSKEEAAEHFGWFAHFAAMDIAASSKQTQESLGWKPVQPGLLTDIDRDSYFAV